MSLPFGDGQSCSGNDPSPLHFTGKMRDTESGLDDFGARYYSSRFGRWNSPDWAASAEAVPYANFSDPQSLNLYSYVKNHPMSLLDSDGHDGHTGLFGLTRDWLDVIEVSASGGFGWNLHGQAGVARGRVQGGVTSEWTTGVGGGNGNVETFAGVRGEGRAGPAHGEVRAGVTLSTKDGASLSAKAEGSAGPLSGSVAVDKNGLHTDSQVSKTEDSKLGGGFTLVVGVGVALNFSQAHRAWARTVRSSNEFFSEIVNTMHREIPALTTPSH